MSEQIGKFIADNLFSGIASIVGFVVLYYLKQLLRNASLDKHHLLSTTDLDVYGEIVEKLTCLRMSTSADRAYIISIRNGDVQINNLHQHKMYCDYEVSGDGIMELKQHMQGIAVQDMYDMVIMYFKGTRVTGVYPNNGVHCYSVDELENGYAKTLFKSLGTSLSYHIVLRDSDSNILGVIGIDYIDSIPDVGNALDCLRITKERVECILKEANANKSR